MNDTAPKPWYLSRTIVASALGILAGFVGIVTHGRVQIDAAALADLIEQAVPVIAGAVAIWGRQNL
jgi:hypothetical protein